MRYLFLAYGDKRQWEAMSEAEREALTGACAANDEALRLLGYLLDVQRLERGCAVTMRVHHGKVSLAEGSLAQGQEQLRGIFSISARDLNQTIQLATTLPPARGGPSEVRPLSEFEREQPCAETSGRSSTLTRRRPMMRSKRPRCNSCAR